jgi:hypothetical protein
MRVYLKKHTIYQIPVCTGSEIEKWGSMEFENLHYVTVEIEHEREEPEYDGRALR